MTDIDKHVWDLKNRFHLGLMLFAAVSAAVSCLYKGTIDSRFFIGWITALSIVVFFFLWHVHYHGITFTGSAWYGFSYAPLADVVNSSGIIYGVPLWVIVNIFFLLCRVPMIPVYFLYVIFIRVFGAREWSRGVLTSGGLVAAAGAMVHAGGWLALRELVGVM